MHTAHASTARPRAQPATGNRTIMILGLGIDVTEISRIRRLWKKFGLRFAEKILHPAELAALRPPEAQFLASRFAVKEAAVKALGTGFSGGITPGTISVDTLPGGQPALRFHGPAKERFTLLGATCAHISLTHGKETVAAVVILEKTPNSENL